jgi:hypothetical protein
MRGQTAHLSEDAEGALFVVSAALHGRGGVPVEVAARQVSARDAVEQLGLIRARKG